MQPVESLYGLKSRVDRFFKAPPKRQPLALQLTLKLDGTIGLPNNKDEPFKSPTDFINNLSKTFPSTEIYLFGGLLRDLAIFGRKGFSSDIDIVIDGDCQNFFEYISTLGATLNKFGGYRLNVAGWPVDIWNARHTWAIAQGFVRYDSIESLTKTTILNWDAILMNWRSRELICEKNYIDSIKKRKMDVVLLHNPNPKGAAVRVFRHLCLKDAKSITEATAQYLASSTKLYQLQDLKSYELYSYSNSFIEPSIYEFFKKIRELEDLAIRDRFTAASRSLLERGIAPPYKQLKWSFL